MNLPETDSHFMLVKVPGTALTERPVIRIKISIMGHFLLTFRISMGHSTFFVNISDFNGTLIVIFRLNVINGTWPPLIPITERLVDILFKTIVKLTFVTSVLPQLSNLTVQVPSSNISSILHS